MDAPDRSVIREPESAIERAMQIARDEERLAAVAGTALVGAGIQVSLQRYARLASEIIGVPTSFVSVVGDVSQYHAAAIGLDGLEELPLEKSYCRHVVAESEQLVVEDTRKDSVFYANPTTMELGVRAYLGSPVCVDGQNVGAFCVTDKRPREWDERAKGLVEDLAAAISTDMELRTRLIREAERAVLDPLTGLGNRRALEVALTEGFGGGGCHLGLLDLDGFKAYNDRFGHPAGDDLLRRLASRLQAGPGRAFRIGGDEFCVVAENPADVLASSEALREEGPGFKITASLGVVAIPREATDPVQALTLADSRLYAVKRARPGSVDDQVTAALLGTLAERDGAVDCHSLGVAELCARVARELGLTEAETHRITLAARLHDIGKVAIPDSVLLKPGPLDDDEWTMMRRHTLVGERIISAAPSLSDLGGLVRSCHERFDGDGYPDGLSGTDIPLGSRIIFACDSFDAMTSDRPYNRPLSTAEAVEELRRCAGGQFDPRVVEAFCAVVQREGIAERPRPAPGRGALT